MIRSHYREPTGPGATRPAREGAIVFGVDETGNLIGRKVVNSSGSPNSRYGAHDGHRRGRPIPGAAELAAENHAFDLRTLSFRFETRHFWEPSGVDHWTQL